MMKSLEQGLDHVYLFPQANFNKSLQIWENKLQNNFLRIAMKKMFMKTFYSFWMLVKNKCWKLMQDKLKMLWMI